MAKSMGSATMRPDGSIFLRLSPVSSSGVRGDGSMVIGKTDERYEKVLKRVGGLKVGESKILPSATDSAPQ